MRWLARVFHDINDGLHRHLLYPLKRFLSLQHFTGVIMLLYALSLVTQPSVVFLKLAEVLHFDALPQVAALVFTIVGTILVIRSVREATYRLLLLPLFIYFVIVVWYIAAGYTTGWSGAIGAIAVWGFFNIAGTTLPPMGGDDDAGTQ